MVGRSGAVLGAEPELMERYGVSRAVLREAVRIVEYLGVARMRQGPGGGLVVAAPNATAVTSAALVYFAYDRVKLEEVLGARRIVEEMAVELAATRAPDAQLDHLRSWLAAANGRATERVEQWELHDVVAGLTGNPGIVLFVKIISRITALYGASGRRSAAKRRQERAATMAAHDRIVDAICARDAAPGPPRHARPPRGDRGVPAQPAGARRRSPSATRTGTSPARSSAARSPSTS